MVQGTSGCGGAPSPPFLSCTLNSEKKSQEFLSGQKNHFSLFLNTFKGAYLQGGGGFWTPLCSTVPKKSRKSKLWPKRLVIFAFLPCPVGFRGVLTPQGFSTKIPDKNHRNTRFLVKKYIFLLLCYTGWDSTPLPCVPL